MRRTQGQYQNSGTQIYGFELLFLNEVSKLIIWAWGTNFPFSKYKVNQTFMQLHNFQNQRKIKQFFLMIFWQQIPDFFSHRAIVNPETSRLTEAVHWMTSRHLSSPVSSRNHSPAPLSKQSCLSSSSSSASCRLTRWTSAENRKSSQIPDLSQLLQERRVTFCDPYQNSIPSFTSSLSLRTQLSPGQCMCVQLGSAAAAATTRKSSWLAP